jgi:Fumarylacetoacetate (FAA) hydrolase family
MHPGEVIGSGTVGTGCLLELNGSKVTEDLWLKAGDEVVLEVQGLGRLVNIVVHAPERLMGVTPNLLCGTLPDLYAGSPTGEAGD